MQSVYPYVSETLCNKCIPYAYITNYIHIQYLHTKLIQDQLYSSNISKVIVNFSLFCLCESITKKRAYQECFAPLRGYVLDKLFL